MGIFQIFEKAKPDTTAVTASVQPIKDSDDIFKAYIPNFLYKPSYGMPRRDNPIMMRKLAANPYVFPIIKTLADEVTTIKWKITVKEEYNKEGEDTDDEENVESIDYDEKIKDITKFFRNPNGNEESLNHLSRQLVTDIFEVDSGVLVKVFNVQGEFKQLFCRDGSLFLKNPDIYGYLGNKRDFVQPMPTSLVTANVNLGGTPTTTQNQIMKQYDMLYKEEAAYFQYGWTAGSMPIPFGKREIVYIMQNPRSDSIYGRSPVSVLTNVILNLVYGVDFNLDYYTNNNMPDGVLQLLGASPAQIEQYRANMDSQFTKTDAFGKKVKTFFKIPITNVEAKFTPFSLSAKEMEIIAQQEWFTKVLWMNFGVTAEEMGFTENSNKATGETQTKLAKRKALGPLLELIAYHINTQIMTEFFVENGELPDYSDIPLQFEYDVYDTDEDKKELEILKLEKDLGIKTEMMIAKERGIDLEELEKEMTKKKEEEQAMFENQNIAQQENPNNDGDNPNPKQDPEEKALSPLAELNKYIDGVGDSIVKNLEEAQDEHQL